MNTYSYRSPKWLFTGGIVVHCTLLYLQTQMRFLIGGKRVTCRGSKSLTPKGNNNLSFRLARDQVVLFETAANLWVSAGVKQTSSQFFLFFCWASPQGILRVSGKQNSLFPWNQSLSSYSRFYVWSLLFSTCTYNLRIHDKRGWFLTLLIAKPLWNNKCHMFT